jgi:hypothetical protein
MRWIVANGGRSLDDLFFTDLPYMERRSMGGSRDVRTVAKGEIDSESRPAAVGEEDAEALHKLEELCSRIESVASAMSAIWNLTTATSSHEPDET